MIVGNISSQNEKRLILKSKILLGHTFLVELEVFEENPGYIKWAGVSRKIKQFENLFRDDVWLTFALSQSIPTYVYHIEKFKPFIENPDLTKEGKAQRANF
jgi:hypothetical protein